MGFVTETSVKAVRKRHRCDGCRQYIEIGEPAVRWAGTTDGDFSTAIYHLDCRAAEIHWNNRILDYRYGDEWTPLYEVENDDYPWLIEAFPKVAERMGVSIASKATGTESA